MKRILLGLLLLLLLETAPVSAEPPAGFVSLFDGIAVRGPIALQHHGGKNKSGEWSSPPALVQFRNIFIREN